MTEGEEEEVTEGEETTIVEEMIVMAVTEEEEITEEEIVTTVTTEMTEMIEMIEDHQETIEMIEDRQEMTDNVEMIEGHLETIGIEEICEDRQETKTQRIAEEVVIEIGKTMEKETPLMTALMNNSDNSETITLLENETKNNPLQKILMVLINNFLEMIKMIFKQVRFKFYSYFFPIQ